MGWCRFIWSCTNRGYVALVCVWNRHSMRSQSYHTLTWLAMTSLRICPSHVWNRFVLALGKQDVRFYSRVLEFGSGIRVLYNMDALSKYTTHYNGDGGRARMFAECMERCRVGPGQKGGKFVIMCAQIRRYISCSIQQYEVVISLDVLSKYFTMLMTAVRLCSLNASGCRPRRAESKFVLLCVWMQTFGLSSLQYEVAISPDWRAV